LGKLRCCQNIPGVLAHNLGRPARRSVVTWLTVARPEAGDLRPLCEVSRHAAEQALGIGERACEKRRLRAGQLLQDLA